MRYPKISVIIPAYNYASYLGLTLGSIFAQAWPDECLEIIVVDDGSTDNTKEVVSAFASPSVKYIGGKNYGVSAARNIGLGEATGDFLMFLDADDLLDPGYFSAQCGYLENNPQIDIAIALNERFFSLLPDKLPVSLGSWRLRKKHQNLHLAFLNIAPIHAYMIRRSKLPPGARFPISQPCCEDYDFWFNCMKNRLAFGCNASAKVFYRFHPGGASRNLARELRYDCLMLKRVGRYLSDSAGQMPQDLHYGSIMAHLAATLTIIKRGMSHAPDIVRVCALEILPGIVEKAVSLQRPPVFNQYEDCIRYYEGLSGQLVKRMQSRWVWTKLPPIQELLEAISKKTMTSEESLKELEKKVFAQQKCSTPAQLSGMLSAAAACNPQGSPRSARLAARSLFSFIAWMAAFIWKEKIGL